MDVLVKNTIKKESPAQLKILQVPSFATSEISDWVRKGPKCVKTLNVPDIQNNFENPLACQNSVAHNVRCYIPPGTHWQHLPLQE